MIVVENTMRVLEIEGKEVLGSEGPTIRVMSHWNRNELVVIAISHDDLKSQPTRFAVAARDLEAAIKNATNSGRF